MIRKFYPVFTLFLTAAASASAQDRNLEIDPSIVRVGFDQSLDVQGLSSCVGAAANHCQQLPFGDDTFGVSKCTGLEADLWDELMQGEFDALGSSRALDDVHDAMTLDPLGTLDAAKTAWVAYRDAECRFAQDFYGLGSIRSDEAAGCRLRTTAARAIQLRNKAS